MPQFKYGIAMHAWKQIQQIAKGNNLGFIVNNINLFLIIWIRKSKIYTLMQIKRLNIP